nr:hypothetical protein [Tanacetum cinerariifolium]
CRSKQSELTTILYSPQLVSEPEVAIQTHGYDTWQEGESNVLITMALTGRLSNTSYMGFQYSVENVMDHLTTNGITAIPGERRSIEELEGMSWNLKPPEQTSVRVPSRVAVNERLNRSDCLNEARILEGEPLNKVRRSNKPRRSRRRSEEKWSTLGEPSGKWDYYVRYDAPINTTPIDEIAATGWGEEFSDDEVNREEFSDDEVNREEFSDDEEDDASNDGSKYRYNRKGFNMKNMCSHPLHKKNQPKAINLHMIQSWGHQSIHRRNRIHNRFIGQTISLVILKAKVNYLVEDM